VWLREPGRVYSEGSSVANDEGSLEESVHRHLSWIAFGRKEEVRIGASSGRAAACNEEQGDAEYRSKRPPHLEGL
jgi:hypothetical protein